MDMVSFIDIDETNKDLIPSFAIDIEDERMAFQSTTSMKRCTYS